MHRSVFDAHRQFAVCEPVHAPNETPPNLLSDEADLYSYLRSLEKGRLEQEFISHTAVTQAIEAWHHSDGV